MDLTRFASKRATLLRETKQTNKQPPPILFSTQNWDKFTCMGTKTLCLEKPGKILLCKPQYLPCHKCSKYGEKWRVKFHRQRVENETLHTWNGTAEYPMRTHGFLINSGLSQNHKAALLDWAGHFRALCRFYPLAHLCTATSGALMLYCSRCPHNPATILCFSCHWFLFPYTGQIKSIDW